MEDKIIILDTFESPVRANIIKSKLESYGVPCFLTNENIIGLNPIYNQSVGGVKLQIFEKDLQKSIEILKQDNSIIDYGNENDIVCPICQSTNVSFGPATKKRFGLFIFIVSFLLLVFPFNIRKVYHCHNCEHEFQL